jgi:hypothetical protein
MTFEVTHVKYRAATYILNISSGKYLIKWKEMNSKPVDIRGSQGVAYEDYWLSGCGADKYDR